jgi:cytochrome d ubiquinol oxidase subunit II
LTRFAHSICLGDRLAYHAPFVGALGLFVMSYAGIAISLWPMIVPLLLVGTLVLLPVILAYTAWSYWEFRGKVRGDIGYH